MLDTEAIAHHTDAELAAGTAGCNQRSTIVSANGVLDPSKLPSIANDCMHMVVNNDPGLKAFLASNASPQAKAERYLVMLTRSRFDVYPPVNATPTGTHSAVFVPNRPAQVKGNTKNRPAYVWLSDENGGCPLNFARMVSVESEITPIMVGAFAIPDNDLNECLEQPNTEPNGQPRRNVAQQNHNPTIFKNLVFNTWYGHGLRAIDISRPANAARSRPRHAGAARHRQNVPGVQGRVDLLGGQPHWSARRAIHRPSRRRVARAGFGRLRGERDESAPVTGRDCQSARSAETSMIRFAVKARITDPSIVCDLLESILSGQLRRSDPWRRSFSCFRGREKP